MKQIIELMATLDPGAKDYFKPKLNGDLKGFTTVPIFHIFTKDNINDFRFYEKYDPEDRPKFVLRCDYNDITSFIPIDPLTISNLSLGHRISIDNIILEVIKQ